MYPRVLITLFSQSCPSGGALMAFDLEMGVWNNHGFHSPMLANYPINMAGLRGADCYVTACMPGEILRLRADGPAEPLQILPFETERAA